MIRLKTYTANNITAYRTAFLWLGIFLSLLSTNLFSATTAPADKIKAAYIYQLTQFVTWPENTITDNTLIICVLGKEAISNELVSLNQRQRGGLIISVRHPKTIRDAIGCQILYIAKSSEHQLSSILETTARTPESTATLTVSSIPDFAKKGGTIGFFINKNKVRLEINPENARHANIKLNAKLLEVARIVENVSSGEPRP